jgi:hypothetical protein
MKPPSGMNAMMQMMMSSQNTIKIKWYSGKASDYPKWDLSKGTISSWPTGDIIWTRKVLEKLPSSEIL